MKIAMIGHKDFPSRIGGVEVVVSSLAPRLCKMGHSVTVYNRSKDGKKHFFEDGVEVELTPVEATGAFGVAVAAFKANLGEEVQYVILTQPIGYGDETMKMLHVINSNGEIVLFKTLSELIVHGDYYSEHQLTDEAAYRAQFSGLTESTYSDDMTVVSGATITSHAVATSHRAAFEVFNNIKEAA